jgi:2-oxoisovalerate dehydrogenase E1 component alpha subunit
MAFVELAEKRVDIPALTLSPSFARDLYSRMLLTRIIDERLCLPQVPDQVGTSTSCRGREAIQVGSAICIEVGKDFTLPYYRDLGVVLTIGMTPNEIFRAHFQEHRQQRGDETSNSEHATAINHSGKAQETLPGWHYQKHNMVSSSASIATQALHAAGIAFAVKLRKAPIVSVAYCGDGAAREADFLEGISFAMQHRLPFICIYEQDDAALPLQSLPLPAGLTHVTIDGTDVIAVHEAMHAAMEHARNGNGPVLLEMNLPDSAPTAHKQVEDYLDPLIRCRQYLEAQGAWDEQWADQLRALLTKEIEQAWQEAQ